jgi:formate-dependent phosphoribosylglycinamide formyltransferase (GAR transformylase)
MCKSAATTSTAGSLRRMSPEQIQAAQAMAEKVTTDLGGAGLFGVEFFRDERRGDLQ